MKKGLNVTLMTVAIAVMALQAMAMAPVIGDIKSPVVGNEPGATAATAFIYPDAFDITTKASDPDGSPTAANIRWSYATVGTPIYRINNVDAITVGTDDINNPGAKRINGTTDDPVTPKDTNTATITIRNVKYAPISGDPTATASGAGIVDSQVVTLFASDGTTNSSKDVIFYTDDGGNDRITGQGEGTWTPVYDPTLPGTWGYEFLIGTVTSSTSGNTALCLDSAAAGINFAGWRSPWGVVPISKNTVYRIRAHVNGSQTTAGSVPFFDLVIDNYNSNTSTGLNLYGGDFMILDNEGGASAPLTTRSGMTYTWVWCPASIKTAAFNDSTELWGTSNATARSMELQFRVLDVNNNGGITADADSGSICLTELTVESLPYDSLSFTTDWERTSLDASNWNAAGVISTAATYSGGVCTLTPTGAATGASAGAEYASAGPGDGDKGSYTPATSGELVDDYPVVWAANTLYQVNFKLAAPDATAAGAPFDIYWVGMDAATNEFIAISYVTNTVGMCATPKAGTAQEYVAFMYSHNVSLTSLGDNAKRLRPRCEFGTVTSMIGSANTGAVQIHGVTVSKVTAPE